MVSSFNYQEKAKKRFDALNEELCEKAERAEKYSGSIMPFTQMVNNIGYAVSGLVGCLLVLDGQLTVGNVQSALQYTKTFQQPFTTFAQMSSQLSAAHAAGQRIFGFLDAEEEIPDAKEGQVPTSCSGTVEFKHVQFGYTPDHLTEFGFLSSLLFYFKTNLRRGSSQGIANLTGTIYLGVVITLLILHLTGTFILLMIVLLMTEVKGSRDTLYFLLSCIPLILTLGIDLMDRFISIPGAHFFWYGMAITMFVQIVALCYDLRQQYLERLRYEKMLKG